MCAPRLAQQNLGLIISLLEACINFPRLRFRIVALLHENLEEIFFSASLISYLPLFN
jgi:hypothetical protein